MSAIFKQIVQNPKKSILTAKLRPNFTFNETNEKDVVSQLAIQLCLMGHADFVKTESEKKDDEEVLLSQLFDKFTEIAKQAETDEQLKSLKKLKKLIHAFARVINPEYFESGEATKRIVNLKKLERSNQKDKALNDVKPVTPIDEKATVSNQKYTVLADTKLVTPINERTKRKIIKSRINRFSFGISIIVGLGEGLIAAVFAASAWPFLLGIVAVGIPAAICNYFLFRGASYSVIKDIVLGQKSDDAKTRKFKNISTFFSSMAGLSYGFLSFGSALVAFGHLLFGLSLIAAMLTPPGALIAIAAIVAVVTAIAISTLYDYMIRNWIDKRVDKKILGKLKNLKKDFINFCKPENGKTFQQLSKTEKAKHIAKKTLQGLLHITFFVIAIAVSVVVAIVATTVFRAHAVNIFKGVFSMSISLSNRLATAITVGMGAIVNGIFYVKSAIFSVDALKKMASSIVHPVKTYNKAKQSCNDFSEKNTHQKTEVVFNAVKRSVLLGTVVMNSIPGQAIGMGRDGASTVADTFRTSNRIGDATGATAVGLASGGANAMSVINATQGETKIDIDLAKHVAAAADATEETSIDGCTDSPRTSQRTLYSEQNTQVFFGGRTRSSDEVKKPATISLSSETFQHFHF